MILLGWLAPLSPAQEPAPHAAGATVAEATATLDDGRSFRGTLIGGANPVFLVRPAGPELPALRIREVVFREGVAAARPGPPAMRITLRNQDQITAHVRSLAHGDPSIARLALFDEPREVPLAALCGLWQRPQHILWLYEGFEAETSKFATSRPPLPIEAPQPGEGRRALRIDPAEQNFECELPGTLEAGYCELGYSDPGEINPRWEWALELGFGPRKIEIAPGWSEANVVVRSPGGPLAVQPLKRRKGWHALRLALSATQLQVAIDGAVLAQGDRPAQGLDSLRVVIRPLPGAKAEPAQPFFFDDVKIYRAAAALAARRRQPTQEILTLAAGDEVFGELESASAGEIRLRGPFGSQGFPLAEFRSLEFRGERPRPASVTGWRVRAWLRSPEPPPANPGPDEPVTALDRLTGALVEASEHDVLLQHPWLGRVPLPLGVIERLETLGHGTRWELDPLFHHLGNDPRRDFPVIAPEGSDLKVDFQWDPASVSGGTLWLCLDTVDLESFDGQHAKALKAGHLATSVLVNEQLLEATLNRHVKQTRERIRLAVPAGLLKAGANRILIHAKPAENDPQELDDFGIDGVALELDTRPPR